MAILQPRFGLALPALVTMAMMNKTHLSGPKNDIFSDAGALSMKTLIRWVAVLALVLIGVGFYRGWFTMTGERESENNKAELKLSVDTEKVKQDTDAVRDGIQGKESQNEH